MSEFILLSDHPLFSQPIIPSELLQYEETEKDPETTFNLGLTDKQKRAREGIVLPYFDAQVEGGIGQGGRILYEMGAEDREDFDDEEDEV